MIPLAAIDGLSENFKHTIQKNNSFLLTDDFVDIFLF